MGFTYLHLSYDKDGKVVGQLTDSGSLKSVGSANTRLCLEPFAVFQLDEFTGLDYIDTDDLVEELKRRLDGKSMFEMFKWTATDSELIEAMKSRLRGI